MGNKEVDLLTLKRNAILLGLCGQYGKRWDGCSSKRDLVNMALDGNGIEFMADSIAFGWGLSKEYLQREFGDFMNGNYQCIEKGYTSEMYIGVSGVVCARSTLLLVGYCNDFKVVVPKNMACRIYMCGGSKVNIENRGHAEIYEYGTDNIIHIIDYDGSYSLRQAVSKSKWNNCTGKEK